MRRRWGVAATLAVALTVAVVPTPRAGSDASPEFVANFAGSVPAPAPAPARAVVDAGLAVWSSLLSTEVPVVIDVTWEALPAYVAGASEPLEYATDPATGYQLPIALANARAGRDLDPSRGDVRLLLSNRERWHYDVNSPAPAGVVDLMSFVLHEVGHGIGF